MSTEKTAVDLHVGKRLRRRRRLLGLTQQQLGEAVGLKFQQIQKYEAADNRIVPAKLYALAVALNIPISYFFEGLQTPQGNSDSSREKIASEEEADELISGYLALSERSRRKLRELLKELKQNGS